jgi:aryl-alcohol dehydrogenase-like predicted oxidoreductase
MASKAAPKMEYTRLGNSGLKISKVIYGAMSFGSPEWQDWVIDEAAALPLLKVRTSQLPLHLDINY